MCGEEIEPDSILGFSACGWTPDAIDHGRNPRAECRRREHAAADTIGSSWRRTRSHSAHPDVELVLDTTRRPSICTVG